MFLQVLVLINPASPMSRYLVPGYRGVLTPDAHCEASVENSFVIFLEANSVDRFMFSAKSLTGAVAASCSAVLREDTFIT